MSARWATLAALLPGMVLAGGTPAGLTLDQALQLGKTLGTNNNANVSTLADHPDLSTVPGYQGTDVPQTQYGSAGAGIDDLARQALPDNPVGQFVQQSALTRPQFTFTPSDPVLQRGNAVTSNPQAVIGQPLSGQNSSCQTVMNCTGQSFCLNGNCFDTGYTPDQDFALAASQLGAVDAAAKDFNTTTMTIFQGRDMRCGKSVLGFSNCCKASGWGIDLSLAQCTGEEKQLGQQREGGQCHYVGDYCSDHSLFGCMARKETYCCFNSKLARIIQEQGRPQLGLSWGSAQAPDCSGITPQQLTNIDFSRIDFSEFYADALTAANNASRPSPDQMKATIEQHLQGQLP